jgi:pyrimidine-nucleoside phosphorylase
MSIDRILERKRDGKELQQSEIEYFITAVTNGVATRAQAAAFLAFVYHQGMSEQETVALTLTMADSGYRLHWSEFDAVIADKHSTGGVGDKVSLILAPLWATLGSNVPMISGRGLGHTGGTLDKLEAIAGYQVTLPEERLKNILRDVGCFICGQTEALAPADRILYALRNETSTVPCIPLIVGSILSKKLAAGIDKLVMDVKFGSGAFMKTKEEAQILADALVRVGSGAGMQMRAVLSDMNQPLGRAIGNAIEVEEAIQCLQGQGPEDLTSLVCDLIGDPRASDVLRSGAAYEKWQEMVRAQGGLLSDPLKGIGCQQRVLEASETGVVQRCDAYSLGYATVMLGGGRKRADEAIHHGVGIWLHAKVGETVEKGQPLATILHNNVNLKDAVALIEQAFVIGQ